MEISNKSIIVTGGANGIGKALAKAFKDAGAAYVLIADLDDIEGEKTAKEIDVKFKKTNVAVESEIIDLINTANEDAGRIDIFCSNAGIGGAPMLLDVTTEDWQNIWEVNVMSHIHAAKNVLPQMLEQGSGYLVNTSSAAGLLTQVGLAPYSVTKAAALSLAEWIKITYGKKGIGVSCLCPQAVNTAMTANGAGTAGVDGMIEPEECATAVLKAIEKEQFLITPHKEVLEYISRKANDYDRWINGMQRLQGKFEEFYGDLFKKI